MGSEVVNNIIELFQRKIWAIRWTSPGSWFPSCRLSSARTSSCPSNPLMMTWTIQCHQFWNVLERFVGKYEESCRPDQRGNSKIRIVRKKVMSTLPLAHILSLWSMKSLLKPALFTTSVLKWDALKTEIGIRRQRGVHVDENWWYHEFFAPGAGVFSFLPLANMSCCLWSRPQLFCVGCLSCPTRIFLKLKSYEWWFLLWMDGNIFLLPTLNPP